MPVCSRLVVHALLLLILLHEANNVLAEPRGVLDAIELAGNAISAVDGISNIRKSFDPERYEPFDSPGRLVATAASEQNGGIMNRLKQIGDCNAEESGMCCLMPNYCHPLAECSSTAPNTRVVSWFNSVPICRCLKGYKGDGRTQGTGCINVDECATGEAQCEQICLDMSPGFLCGCNKGFRPAADGRSCDDIDECKEKSDDCDQVCINTVGSYHCACRTGYELKENGKECQDINECELMDEIVKYGEGLVKSLSKRTESYKDSLKICQYPDLCINLEGAYSCDCPLGFKPDQADLSSCMDINECLEGITDPRNQIFSSNNTLASIASPVCLSSKESSKQFPSQLCTNYEGRFECSCSSGFESQDTPTPTAAWVKLNNATTINNRYVELIKKNQQLECHDIDECTEGAINPCTGESNSQRQLGLSYRAMALPQWTATFQTLPLSPEELSPRTELDIWATPPAIQNDERLLSGSSQSNEAVCINEIGNYKCECPPRFEFSNSKKKCVDVDECADSKLNLCLESAGELCVNLHGSYECRCAKGYKSKLNQESFNPAEMNFQELAKINGQFCTEVDVCQMGIMECDYACEKFLKPKKGLGIGAYRCVCPAGYTIDPANGTKCIDINECDLEMCPPSGICYNFPGGYLCSCPEGQLPAAENGMVSKGPTNDSISKTALRLIASMSLTRNSGSSSFNESFIDWTEAPWSSEKTAIQKELAITAGCNSNSFCQILRQIFPSEICPGGSKCVDSVNSFYCRCPAGFQLGSKTVSSNGSSNNLEQKVRDEQRVTGESETRGILGRFFKRRSLAAIEEQSIQDEVSMHALIRSLGNTLSVGDSLNSADNNTLDMNEILTSDEINLAQQLGALNQDNMTVPLWIIKQLPWNDFIKSGGLLNGGTCKDIDECQVGINASRDLSNVCSLNSPCCENTIGSFKCFPKRGGLTLVCPSETKDLSSFKAK